MLQGIIDWLTYGLFRLDPQDRISEALNFFIYDSVKILLLLFVMISAIGFLRTFLPQKKVKRWLAAREGLSHCFAAMFGAVTPFCSCSSIPIFLGFLEAGIPLGVAFSFLITSPLINEYLVVLMIGFFGWKITALYVLSGMILGIVSGLVIGRMRMEGYLEKGLITGRGTELKEAEHSGIKSRLIFGLHEAYSIVGKLWPWVLVGVGTGALIHNYVPQGLIQNVIARAGVFSVPIATALGVPMYGSCAAIVPIAIALFNKGIPLGTALSFMMAIAALSLPEAILLRRAMKMKLIVLFFGITAMGIIFTGYLFNGLYHLKPAP